MLRPFAAYAGVRVLKEHCNTIMHRYILLKLYILYMQAYLFFMHTYFAAALLYLTTWYDFHDIFIPLSIVS